MGGQVGGCRVERQTRFSLSLQSRPLLSLLSPLRDVESDVLLDKVCWGSSPPPPSTKASNFLNMLQSSLTLDDKESQE